MPTKSTKSTKSTKTTKKSPNSAKAAEKSTNIAAPIIGAVVAALVIIVLIVIGVVIVDHNNRASAVGTYTLTGLITSEGVNESDQIPFLESLDIKTTIELKSGGTCVLTLFGDEHECTYDNANIYYDGTTNQYAHSGNTLSFATDGNTLTFTKAEDK